MNIDIRISCFLISELLKSIPTFKVARAAFTSLTWAKNQTTEADISHMQQLVIASISLYTGTIYNSNVVPAEALQSLKTMVNLDSQPLDTTKLKSEIMTPSQPSSTSTGKNTSIPKWAAVSFFNKSRLSKSSVFCMPTTERTTSRATAIKILSDF